LSKSTKTPRPTDKLFLFYKNRGNPNIYHRSVFQFCWPVNSCFWELRENKNWRENRRFHLVQKLFILSQIDVLISCILFLQKPTNPQRKQAFYSRFLRNRRNDIRCFQELAVKGGIQDSFWGEKAQCSEGQQRLSRLFKAALLHPPQIVSFRKNHKKIKIHAGHLGQK
jgi:hypothetical protein